MCTISYFPTIDSGNGRKASWAIRVTFFGSHASGGHCASDKSTASMDAVGGSWRLSSMGQMLGRVVFHQHIRIRQIANTR